MWRPAGSVRIACRWTCCLTVGFRELLLDRIADYVARLKAAGKRIELVEFPAQGHRFSVLLALLVFTTWSGVSLADTEASGLHCSLQLVHPACVCQRQLLPPVRVDYLLLIAYPYVHELVSHGIPW
ncbi:hypothetical protein ACUV84_036962 [Puccinellia chinampoensis]